MGKALLPHHDARERELPPQGPIWRAGGPAMLRALILTLLWRGSLSQPPGFTLVVPQLVSVQEGLCVLIPCNFTYPASYDTDNPSAELNRQWYKEPATVGQDHPVASNIPTVKVSQETQGRFRLTEDPAHGNCSLQISDARQTDAGRYFLYGKHPMSLSDSLRSPRVSELTEEPEIQISPARGMPGMLLAGEPVTVTCTAPGRCSGRPPRVTWTGPFSDTARNVSAQLANSTWAHSSALNFTPGLGDHGKELVCNVTYHPPQGPSTSRTIQLHVDYAWGAEGDVVSLETQEGDSLSLSCEAGSRADANLSWARVNGSLSSGQGGAGRLELPNLSQGDAGEYQCWAKNSYGSASQALRVHVQCKVLGGAAVSQEASGGLPPTGLLSLTIVAGSPTLPRQSLAGVQAELILPAPGVQHQLQLLPALPPPTPAPVAGGRGAPGWECLTGGPAHDLMGPGG
uniref:Ig-like domain-containing protein n=1 Tax=Terrapene triunguis TaxID=2587831 RepID=A0A674JIR7_9SAUR